MIFYIYVMFTIMVSVLMFVTLAIAIIYTITGSCFVVSLVCSRFFILITTVIVVVLRIISATMTTGIVFPFVRCNLFCCRCCC